jgi:hypothetical protein
VIIVSKYIYGSTTRMMIDGRFMNMTVAAASGPIHSIVDRGMFAIYCIYYGYDYDT